VRPAGRGGSTAAAATQGSSHGQMPPARQGVGGWRRLAFQGAGNAWGGLVRRLLEKPSYGEVTFLLYMTQIIE